MQLRRSMLRVDNWSYSTCTTWTQRQQLLPGMLAAIRMNRILKWGDWVFPNLHHAATRREEVLQVIGIRGRSRFHRDMGLLTWPRGQRRSGNHQKRRVERRKGHLESLRGRYD